MEKLSSQVGHEGWMSSVGTADSYLRQPFFPKNRNLRFQKPHRDPWSMRWTDHLSPSPHGIYQDWFKPVLVISVLLAIRGFNLSHSGQFSSVAQSCPALCDPMNHSIPSLPVHHQLPEFTQTHVHRVSDAIQPSHPLSSPSPPAPNPSQHQSLFQWVNSSHEVAKSFQRNPRADLLQNGLVGSPCSPRDSQESSPTPQFKSINSLALSLLHSPTFTSIHDHWKNHILD